MKDLFSDQAYAYLRYRPKYPKELYQIIRREFQKEKFNLAVDVGCGAGQSTMGLLDISKQVIGIEPSQKLLNLALKTCKSFPNIKFLKGYGERIGLKDSTVDLITVATAFYWMDTPKALKELNRILIPQGGLAIYQYGWPKGGEDFDNWAKEEFEKSWDKYRDPALKKEHDFENDLKNSGLFLFLNKQTVPLLCNWSIKDVIGFLSTASFISQYVKKEVPKNYWENVFNKLSQIMKNGTLKLDFSLTLWIARSIKNQIPAAGS